MKRNFGIMVLFTCLLIFFSTPVTLADNVLIKGFSDVDDNQINAVYINYLLQRGILNGYPDGTFRPQEGLTRAEAAVLTVKVTELTASPPTAEPFSDVRSDHWAAGHIAAAAEQGYFQGYPDGSFHPDEQLTRAQAVYLLVRLSGQADTPQTLPLFADMNRQHWAASSAAVAIAAGMINIDKESSYFYPDSVFTRSELTRALAVLLTKNADFYKTELLGHLKVVEGSIELIRNNHKTVLTKDDIASIYPQDIIISGPKGQADLQYPDGSAFLIKDNTEITIKGSDGRSYIKKNGDLGVAVDWLNVELKKGSVFGALAVHTQSKDSNAAINQIAENYLINLPSRNMVASLDNYLYLAEELSADLPWWQVAEQKKVKVKVDMPYGVAAIRGTFFNASIVNGQCMVSCLTGNVEVSNNQGATSLSGGQATQIVGAYNPPTPPAPMPASVIDQFRQQHQWLQQTAQNIDQNQGVGSPESAGSGETSTSENVANALGSENNSPPESMLPADNTSNDDSGSNEDSEAPTIDKIEDIILWVDSLSDYELPDTVEVIMSNQTVAVKPVVWNRDEADNSITNQLRIPGTVNGYIGKVWIIIMEKETEEPTIEEISDVEVIVDSFDEYTPDEYPQTVEVKLSNGTYQQRIVSWNLAGQKETSEELRVPGTVEGYSDTIWLVIIIRNDESPYIKAIKDISITIDSLDEIPYPETVKVIMSDDTVAEKPVFWNLDEADDSIADQLKIPGRVDGYSGTVYLTIVLEPVYEICSLGDNENILKSPYEGDAFRIMIKPEEDFILPLFAEVKLNNGNQVQRPIYWTGYSINGEFMELPEEGLNNTYTPGLYKCFAVIPGYSNDIVLKIRVLDDSENPEGWISIVLEDGSPIPEFVMVPENEHNAVTLRFIALDAFAETISNGDLLWHVDAPPGVSIHEETGDLTICPGTEPGYNIYVTVALSDIWQACFDFEIRSEGKRYEWEKVGDSFYGSSLNLISMNSYNDTLYVAAPQITNLCNKLFNYNDEDESWNSVDDYNPSGTFDIFCNDIFVSDNDMLYIPGLAFNNDAEKLQLTIDCYDGEEWNSIPSLDLPYLSVNINHSMAVNWEGIYVAYQENDDIKVKKYSDSTWGDMPSVAEFEYRESRLMPYITFDEYGDQLYLSYIFAKENEEEEIIKGLKIFRYESEGDGNHEGCWVLISEKVLDNPLIAKIAIYNDIIYLGWKNNSLNTTLEVLSDEISEVIRTGLNFPNNLFSFKSAFDMNYSTPIIIEMLETDNEDEAKRVEVFAYARNYDGEREWKQLGITGLNSTNSIEYCMYVSKSKLYLAYYDENGYISVLKYTGGDLEFPV